MRCRVPGLPRTAAAGTSHQRSRGTPASAQLAINYRRPARQRPTTLRACDSVAVWCWATNWARGAQSPRTWWAIYAADAHRPRGTGSVFSTNSRATRRAGELAAADPANRVRGLWPSSAARRTQKAEKDAALRGVRARAGDGHRPRGIRRPRGHSVRCRRGCATRRDKENHHSSVTRVRHHRLVTTVSPQSILSSPSGASGPWRPQSSVSGARS
jgi:hypothetical protein